MERRQLALDVRQWFHTISHTHTKRKGNFNAYIPFVLGELRDFFLCLFTRVIRDRMLVDGRVCRAQPVRLAVQGSSFEPGAMSVEKNAVGEPHSCSGPAWILRGVRHGHLKSGPEHYCGGSLA